MKVSEFLIRALKKLGPNGEHWIRGAWHKKVGDADKYCMMGAMNKTTRECRIQGEVGIPSSKAETMLTMETGISIVAYNDGYAKDFAAIKQVMCAAIKKAVDQEELDDKDSGA